MLIRFSYQLVAACVCLFLALGGPLARGQIQVKVQLPPGTVYLDLNAKGEVRVADRKEPLRSTEDIQKYLREALPAAAKAQKVEKGRPQALVRVREPVDGKRVDAVRKLCREAGFRGGLDLSFVVFAPPPKAPPEQPGEVALLLNTKGEYMGIKKSKRLPTFVDMKAYVKAEYPRAKAEAEKLKGKGTRPGLTVHAHGLPPTFAKELPDLINFTRDTGFDGPRILAMAPGPQAGAAQQRFELD